ncbi:hypothetical protein KGY64_02890 [Candidatus Bipolaricaulota bacterium]|nr:hypothetical protein [Candidatus Bipolaricaulota bacterium]
MQASLYLIKEFKRLLTRNSLIKTLGAVLFILGFIALIYVLLIPKQQPLSVKPDMERFPQGFATVAQIEENLSSNEINELYLSLRRLNSVDGIFLVLSAEIEEGLLKLPSELSDNSDVFLIKTPDREGLLTDLRQEPEITMVSSLSARNLNTESGSKLPIWLKISLLVIAVGLVGLVFFLIKSTTKDVLESWEGEIQIMRYSGLSRGSVKFPIMLFGTLVGLVGSILSLILLFALSQWASSGIWLSNHLASLQSDTHLLILIVWSVLLGVVVGFLSSLFSLREVDARWESNSSAV